MPTRYHPGDTAAWYKVPPPYGTHLPLDRGYDARSRAKTATADDKGSSAFLQGPDGTQINLWVTEIGADFSISGSSGQSRMLREFFPHNFNDVTLKIIGNVPSTQEYNRLALFVREHQHGALSSINSGQTATTVTQTITFALDAPKVPSGSTVKGPHVPWRVHGYISTIAAGAVRHEIGPQFELDFIVTDGNGVWSDSLASGGDVLKTWMQLFAIANGKQRSQGSGFISDPISPPTPPKPAPAPSPASWVVKAANAMFGSLTGF